MLHHALTASARRSPEGIAVRAAHASVTYDALDKAANRLAHALVDHGVQSGSRVGVYLGKSIQAVTAIFGILKAGAVYVPLDVESPIARTARIISDCELVAIVTDAPGATKLRDGDFLRSSPLTLFGNWEAEPSLLPSVWRAVTGSQISQYASTPVSEKAPYEGQLAYILYTSGSTGVPKGIALTHENALVFVRWAVELLGLHDRDVFASHAPFHFDLSIFDIFACALVGGTLCLIPPGYSNFADAVLDFVEVNRVTVWYSVPSALLVWLGLGEAVTRAARTIRHIIYAGEVFPHTHLNELRRRLPGAVIHNWYGPTETNVITHFVIDREDRKPADGPIPIGRACPYARVFVVDPSGREVSPGEHGELVAISASTMAGYWNDPQKTHASLRTLELGGGRRVCYCTGDIVYVDVSGCLHYVGRRDSMVKVRGFRVELGEIESIVNQHPSVERAAVVAVPAPVGAVRLVLYTALRRNAPVDAGMILRFCHDNMPAYMAPHEVCVLEHLPTTTTGKVDRAALRRRHE